MCSTEGSRQEEKKIFRPIFFLFDLYSNTYTISFEPPNIRINTPLGYTRMDLDYNCTRPPAGMHFCDASTYVPRALVVWNADELVEAV